MKIFVQGKLWTYQIFLIFSLNERVYHGEVLKKILRKSTGKVGNLDVNNTYNSDATG